MIYIDVRTKREHDADKLVGIINHDIVQMMQGIFPQVDKDEEITLYCESGNRSMMAKSIMDEAGFTKVIDGGSITNYKM